MLSQVLKWADDTSSPLVEHFRFFDASADTIMVGTGRFSAGQTMPAVGFSQYPMREITVVLQGSIETRSGGEIRILKAGDIVTIPPHQTQVSHFLEDTKLIYLFFGKGVDAAGGGDPSA